LRFFLEIADGAEVDDIVECLAAHFAVSRAASSRLDRHRSRDALV
jgi:hypothetical protein